MMAIAGTPDGKQKYDPEMAAAYLRLLNAPDVKSGEEPDYLPKKMTGMEKKMKRELAAAGFQAGGRPAGKSGSGLRLCFRAEKKQLGGGGKRLLALSVERRALS